MSNGSNKKNAALLAGFAVAATWFASHVGSGFATGRQGVEYFTQYGASAVWTPLFFILVGIALYFVVNFCAEKGISNYAQYAEQFYFPNRPKIRWIPKLYMDVWIGIGQIMGTAAVLAGGAALFKSAFGLNQTLGLILMALCIVIVVLYGAKLMLKISSGLSIGLIITIIIISIYLIITKWDNLSTVLGNYEINSEFTWWQRVYKGFSYAPLQMMMLGPIIGLVPQMATKKSRDTAIIGGTILNMVMLWLFGMALLSFYPENNPEALPILWGLDKTGAPAILTVLYQILLFLALVTTGAAGAFAIESRYAPLLEKKVKKSVTRNTIVLAVLLIVCIVVASFGLIAIFKTGYGFTAKLCLPGVFLPIFVLGPIRLRQARKANAAKAAEEKAE